MLEKHDLYTVLTHPQTEFLDIISRLIFFSFSSQTSGLSIHFMVRANAAAFLPSWDVFELFHWLISSEIQIVFGLSPP